MPYFKPLLALALICTSTAAAAQNRPLFKHPFPCGQSWDATTYETHGPDPDSLDFTYWRDRSEKAVTERDNLTNGQYILSSAAGEVVRDDIVADDVNGQVRIIRIAHANDWDTTYFHVMIEPPFLTPGRKIAMGEVIGRAGRSGTGFANDHIHYNQRNPSNQAVRVQFDGVNAATHDGDQSTWGLFLSDQAERMGSANCTGHSFIRWRDGGDNYILRYSPNTRRTRITRMDADGTGGTNTWTGENWGRSWTHHAHWTSGSDHFLLQYSAPRGRAQFFRIEPNGTGLALIEDTNTWVQRWTTIKRVNHAGNNYLFVYNSITGYHQILRIDANNRSAAVTWVNDDIRGWTHILPFDQDGGQYVLYYKAASGRVVIRQLVDESRDGFDGTELRLDTVYDGTRRANWTHMTLARDGGTLFMLGFRADNGRARLWEISDPSAGPIGQGQFQLNRKWDIITAMREGGQARIFLYGIDRGDGAVMDVNNDGSGLSSLATFDWQGGWR
ncbi:MAG: M23 family metallopeptidase [Pseudomonadota bacterium]